MDTSPTAAPESGDDVCLAVVEAVADAENVDPVDLERPLHDAIDPSALDAPFANWNGRDGRVDFVYHGYLVTVDGDGSVSLERRVPL